MLFSPIVMVASALLVGLAIYGFVSSMQKGIIGKRKRAYELERVDAINSVGDLEALLGEELSHPEASGILAVLPDSSDRYVRHSEQEMVELYGDSPFSKVLVNLNRHLAKSHNVLVPWEYALLLGIGFVGGFGAGFYMLPLWYFALILGIISAVSVAETTLSRQARGYRENVNRQAIALIQLVIQQLRAGFTPPQAFEQSCKDLGDPIVKELEPLLRALRSQVPMSVACKQAVMDTSSSFLKKIYKVIIMCEKNDMEKEQMAERLIIIRKNLLTEYSLKQAMKANAGGSTMAKNFLTFLVPGLLFFLIKRAPFTLLPLVKTPAGWAVMALGLALYFGGLYSAKKVLQSLEV